MRRAGTLRDADSPGGRPAFSGSSERGRQAHAFFACVSATALALALAGTGCRKHQPVLARVAGRPVTAEDLAAVVRAQTGKEPGLVSPDVVAALFESYLEEEVLLAASGENDDVAVPTASRGTRVRELLAELCPPAAEPSEAEVDARLAGEPAGKERVLIRQLILPDAAAAHAARQRLQAGEDFTALSREVSRAANAAQGGAIGWVERGQLVPEFEAVVFGLPDGGVSQPVASNAGWHVFQVTGHRAASGAADPSTRARAREELMAQAAERAKRGCLRRLAAKVGVEVECEDATFPCRNPFEEQP